MNYFFHIRNGTFFADEEGQAMQGEAVSAEAKAVALELIGEGYRGRARSSQLADRGRR